MHDNNSNNNTDDSKIKEKLDPGETEPLCDKIVFLPGSSLM